MLKSNMQYRRVYIPGGTYFFTVVTYNRYPIFKSAKAVNLLRESFSYTMKRFAFTVVASVILPDHLHFIWTLPPDSSDFSTRWRLIKSYFSRNWPRSYGDLQNPSHALKGEKEIWQRRFWEHLIQDENDLQRHIEYIHLNPVKHGYTSSPSFWEYSSFSKYVQDGFHEPDWGSNLEIWEGIKGME